MLGGVPAPAALSSPPSPRASRPAATSALRQPPRPARPEGRALAISSQRGPGTPASAARSRSAQRGSGAKRVTVAGSGGAARFQGHASWQSSHPKRCSPMAGRQRPLGGCLRLLDRPVQETQRRGSRTKGAVKAPVGQASRAARARAAAPWPSALSGTSVGRVTHLAEELVAALARRDLRRPFLPTKPSPAPRRPRPARGRPRRRESTRARHPGAERVARSRRGGGSFLRRKT